MNWLSPIFTYSWWRVDWYFFLGVNVIKPVSAETLYEPITSSLSPNV